MQRWPELQGLSGVCAERMAPGFHGDSAAWLDALAGLPDIRPGDFALGETVRVGSPEDISARQAAALEASLRALRPWRKGPFELFKVYIDSEWRSDWKWQRINPHIASLANRTVLDVGCGNGYYLFRMLGAGARLAVGLALSLLLIYVINVQSFGWTIQFSLPVFFLAQMSLLVMLATTLSGLYPARRACALPSVEQVVEE